MIEDETLTLVDVGGLGGLGEEWLPYADRLHAVLFEPNPTEAAALRGQLGHCRDAIVVERALGDRPESRTLHVTRSLGCTSLLRPNTALLAAYSIRNAFDVKHELRVECVRFDSLIASGEVSQPDAVKIDVQGFEHQVLEGFGDALREVLAVKLEAHLYPIYHGQKLLHDLIDLLARVGLNLRRIEPVAHFDGDLVEVDAYFSCSPDRRGELDPTRVRKLDFVERVWRIQPRQRSFGADQFA